MLGDDNIDQRTLLKRLFLECAWVNISDHYAASKSICSSFKVEMRGRSLLHFDSLYACIRCGFIAFQSCAVRNIKLSTAEEL